MSKSSEKKRPRDEEADAAAAASKKQKVKSHDSSKKKSKKGEKIEAAVQAEPVAAATVAEPTGKAEKKSRKSKKAAANAQTQAETPSDTSSSEEEEDVKEAATKSGADDSTSDEDSSETDDSSSDSGDDKKPATTATTTSTLSTTTSTASTSIADRPLQSIETKPPGNGYFKPAFAPKQPEFPLYTQTFSIKTSLFPVGFDKPAAAAGTQLLAPMVNRYSNLYHGVLLAYRNVIVSQWPSRIGASETNAQPVKLQSRDEFAAGFAWVTADMDLFVPSVGAWMEGEVVLQTEGHIGVVCWGRFNASIEASRLPRTWRWVAAEEAELEDDSMELDNGTSEGAAALTPQTTGYWADENGTPVDGKVVFRIKRFDVGVRDDHSFISIEGSMLDDKTEAQVRTGELQREENRRAKSSGYLMGSRKRVIDFSVTDCGVQEEEIRDIRSQIDWRRARPPTPTSYSMT
ncbi:DNA-directed RNA polymerase I subunit RPA43 [Ceratocystis lukuohia]|uniref:DNA-directed RNA polymerase subunit n=1 Tax=Ceratocystis lukuohia TaxID=2019550 RepID=A0ABR4M9Q2_9PEZI